jgi:hypothetical protein
MGIELRSLSRPTPSLVTILTELSRSQPQPCPNPVQQRMSLLAVLAKHPRCESQHLMPNGLPAYQTQPDDEAVCATFSS